MDAVQVITLAIAILGAALGVVNAYVQWRTYRKDRPELNVETTWSIPTYGPGTGTRLGPSMIMTTASNTGRHPVGVTGMQLELSDGRSAPFTETVPGCKMPVVLSPGEHTAMWIEADPLAQALRESHVRLARAVVHGPGSQRWVQNDLKGVATLGSDPIAREPRDRTS